MSGDYIATPLPISGIAKVNGNTVYFAYDNTQTHGYVKMVDSVGNAKYYIGTFNTFNPDGWSGYGSADGHYKVTINSPISDPESTQITTVSNIGTMTGEAITGGSVPITGQATINGIKVYLVMDDGYTKMVDISGNGKYYSGVFSKFDPILYYSYTNAKGVYKLTNLITPAPTTKPPESDSSMLLIGGIVGGIILLIILFVIFKKKDKSTDEE
jgi:hypothetical protein